jgi:hypothetical protein
MAESAAHKWGQIIGDLLQHSLREELQKVADRHQLYLDYQRNRPARKGSRVSWQDRYGNCHDLGYELADKTLSGGRKPPETSGTQGAYAPRSGSFVR